jgi:hypothetical protein
MSITNIYVTATVIVEKGPSGLRRILEENVMYMTGLMRGKSGCLS